jgi:protoporphyrinogen oxidase
VTTVPHQIHTRLESFELRHRLVSASSCLFVKKLLLLACLLVTYMEITVKVLVVGSGPTGLGAASRLEQHSIDSWLLVDHANEPGGLACTDVTKEGFLFDMGGHVIFSHYAYFDDIINAAIGVGDDAWNTLQRVSYVWIKNRWVAYPFQNNIAALDDDDKITCLSGMIDAVSDAKINAHDKPKTFDEWILRTMGQGIADMFMRPYNFKVWAYPTSSMQCAWLGERVAAPDVKRAMTNVVLNKEDAGWGPNATFRFPKKGGTGAIWKGVSSLLPQHKQLFGSDLSVVAIDAQAKKVTFANGTHVRYEAMITTMPLDVTLGLCSAPVATANLKKSASHIIGIGLRGHCPHGSKCWLYYPEENCPFYRTTVFSNYAKLNCPAADVCLPTLCHGSGADAADKAARPGPYWSLMFEVSESELKPVDCSLVDIGASKLPNVVRDTLLGAVATKLISADDEVVSIYHRRIEYGYPTPSLGRDDAANQGLTWLRDRQIWSRGRFGSWKYEVGNQDHSLMLGVEAVDNILYGAPELTLNYPNLVNVRKNTDQRYAKKD